MKDAKIGNKAAKKLQTVAILLLKYYIFILMLYLPIDRITFPVYFIMLIVQNMLIRLIIRE